jgi:tetratricopeptide (TPR) repeat protein
MKKERFTKALIALSFSVLILPISAYAFDDLDYQKKMTEQALKEGQPEKALKIINEGLEDDPDNATLRALKSKAESALKTKQRKIADERKANELAAEKKKQDDLKRQELARAKAIEDEKRERPNWLKNALCHCLNLHDNASKQLREEDSIARTTGVIDKVKAHSAGEQIYYLDLTTKHIKQSMSNLGVADPDCSGWKSSGYSSPCSEYQMKYAREIKDLR